MRHRHHGTWDARGASPPVVKRTKPEGTNSRSPRTDAFIVIIVTTVIDKPESWCGSASGLPGDDGDGNDDKSTLTVSGQPALKQLKRCIRQHKLDQLRVQRSFTRFSTKIHVRYCSRGTPMKKPNMLEEERKKTRLPGGDRDKDE